MRKTYSLAGELLYLVRKELGFGELSLEARNFPAFHLSWLVNKAGQSWVCTREISHRDLNPETLELFARHLAREMLESCRRSA